MQVIISTKSGWTFSTFPSDMTLFFRGYTNNISNPNVIREHISYYHGGFLVSLTNESIASTTTIERHLPDTHVKLL